MKTTNNPLDLNNPYARIYDNNLNIDEDSEKKLLDLNQIVKQELASGKSDQQTSETLNKTSGRENIIDISTVPKDLTSNASSVRQTWLDAKNKMGFDVPAISIAGKKSLEEVEKLISKLPNNSYSSGKTMQQEIEIKTKLLSLAMKAFDEAQIKEIISNLPRVAREPEYLNDFDKLKEVNLEDNTNGDKENTPIGKPITMVEKLMTVNKYGNEIYSIQNAERDNNSRAVRILSELALNESQSSNNEDKITYLHQVAGFSTGTALNIGLNKFKNINIKDRFGETPLRYAIKNNNIEGAKILLQAGADINSKSNDGTNALFDAVKHANLKLISLLIDNGIDVNCKTDYGNTPLKNSIRSLKYLSVVPTFEDLSYVQISKRKEMACNEIIKLLLNSGVDVNIKDESNESALSLALQGGGTPDNKYTYSYTKLMETLLYYGADKNVKDTRIDILSPTGEPSVRIDQAEVDSLLRKPNKELFEDNYQTKQYFDSIRSGVVFELPTGMPLNIRDNNGDNGLMVAIKEKKFKLAQSFIDTAIDNKGYDALMEAIINGQDEIVKSILQKHIDLGAKNSKGQNALMLAIVNGQNDIAKNILSRRINLNAKDNNALINVQDEIAKCILSKQINLSDKDNNGNNALMLAVQGYEVEPNFKAIGKKLNDCERFKNYKVDQSLVRLLLSENDINDTNNDGNTALMLASRKLRNKDTAELLLGKKADLNIKNKKGKTALQESYNSMNEFEALCKKYNDTIGIISVREHNDMFAKLLKRTAR
jgi:ankyrin repeat protein